MLMHAGWITAIFFIMCQGLSSASTFEEMHAANLVRNPEGLSLIVQMEKNTFFIGERIPVKLLFQNTSQIEYEIWTGDYDRSGRIQDIGFIMGGPTGGFADPLKTFFGGVISGGGLGNYATLGQYSLSVDLNEWIRFDLPGTYRLYGATNRIVARGDRGLQTRLPLYSPIITFQIELPDNDWIASQIAAAVADLKSSGAAQRRNAVRMLRFLDDPQAILQLVSILSDSKLGGEALLGIMGSKDPYQAKSALWGNLHNPDMAVTDIYFKTLVDLLIPPEIYSLALRSLNPQFKTAQQDAQKQVIQELSAALPLKRGRALYESCDVLLQQEIDQKTVQVYCPKGN